MKSYTYVVTLKKGNGELVRDLPIGPGCSNLCAFDDDGKPYMSEKGDRQGMSMVSVMTYEEYEAKLAAAAEKVRAAAVAKLEEE